MILEYFNSGDQAEAPRHLFIRSRMAVRALHPGAHAFVPRAERRAGAEDHGLRHGAHGARAGRPCLFMSKTLSDEVRALLEAACVDHPQRGPVALEARSFLVEACRSRPCVCPFIGSIATYSLMWE